MSHRSGKRVAIIVLMLSLAACAVPSAPRTTVNVISDRFSPGVILEGVPLQDNRGGGETVFWMLRSEILVKTHAVQHQIYVEWSFEGHGKTKYFAATDEAQSLPVKQIIRESCGKACGQTDTLGIDIDEATLRRRAATGFQVKLSDAGGAHDILDITPPMIAAQLQAEERVLAAPK